MCVYTPIIITYVAGLLRYCSARRASISRRRRTWAARGGLKGVGPLVGVGVACGDVKGAVPLVGMGGAFGDVKVAVVSVKEGVAWDK